MSDKKSVLILGASSDMAKATALRYAKAGYPLILAARDTAMLERDASDIALRYGTEAKTAVFDVTDTANHGTFFESLKEEVEGVISFIGFMGEQETSQKDFDQVGQVVMTNYTGLISIFELFAADFEAKQSGFLVGVSSVAGDRGRKSNYIYGSAKAGFSTYLSGLRNRLFESGVQVLTVKPGFVNTKMTEGMDLPAKLTAEPAEAAEDIFAAQQKGKDVIYTKWFWRYIMLIIKSIPEIIFKRLSL